MSAVSYKVVAWHYGDDDAPDWTECLGEFSGKHARGVASQKARELSATHVQVDVVWCGPDDDGHPDESTVESWVDGQQTRKGGA